MARSRKNLNHGLNKKRNMRRSARRSVRNRGRSMCGAGWSDTGTPYGGKITSVNPGNQIHTQYSGPGKDCAGTPIASSSRVDPRDYVGARGGLPGLAMNGGRYDGLGSSNTWPFGSNAVGAAFGQHQKIACEPTDPRTPGLADLNAIKTASMGANDLPLRTAVKAFPPPYAQGGGGSYQYSNPAPAGLTAGQTNSPPSGIENRYHVGDTTTAAYYAPTAGYANLPMPNPPPANPAILVQNHYDAKSYNQACVGPTRGGRRGRRGTSSRVLGRILKKVRGSKSNTKAKQASNPLPPPNATKVKKD
jgi:hypothetical protein